MLAKYVGNITKLIIQMENGSLLSSSELQSSKKNIKHFFLLYNKDPAGVLSTTAVKNTFWKKSK